MVQVGRDILPVNSLQSDLTKFGFVAQRVDFQVGLDQIRKSWLVSDYLEKKIKFKGTLSLQSIELTRINLVWLDFDKVDKNNVFS